MEVSFKLLDELKIGWIPEKLLWVNFHLTKHFILGFESEGFNNNTELNEKNIIAIREKQIKSYGCKIKDKFQLMDKTCKQCDYQKNCNELLETIKSDYFSVIKNTLVFDVDKPRHVHYFDKKRNKKTLGLIAENGAIVVTELKKSKERCRVKTCFREQYQAHPSFRILADNDDHWFRINAIKFYDLKLSDRQLFGSVEKILMENWTNA
jgi:hypothetical protein